MSSIPKTVGTAMTAQMPTAARVPRTSFFVVDDLQKKIIDKIITSIFEITLLLLEFVVFELLVSMDKTELLMQSKHSPNTKNRK